MGDVYLLMYAYVMMDGLVILVILVCTTWYVALLISKVYIIFPIIAVCEPECLHGLCASPGDCECNEGWTGAVCDIGMR